MKPSEIFSGAGEGWVPWAWVTPILGIAFILGAALTVDVQLEAQGLLGATGGPVGRAGFVAFLTLSFLVIGVAVVVWARLVERRPLAAIGLTDEGAGQKFAFGLLLGVLTSGGLVAAIWYVGGFAVEGIAPAFASADALVYIAVLLACFAVQSSVEEILFRGWMLSALTRRVNVIVAIAIVSAVFALVHFSRAQPPLVTVSTFLFSVFACLLVLKARHIWGAMGWHASWNWLIGVGFEIPITGLDMDVPALIAKLRPVGTDTLTGGADGPEGSIFCVALFFGASLLLLALGALSQRKD